MKILQIAAVAIFVALAEAEKESPNVRNNSSSLTQTKEYYIPCDLEIATSGPLRKRSYSNSKKSVAEGASKDRIPGESWILGVCAIAIGGALLHLSLIYKWFVFAPICAILALSVYHLNHRGAVRAAKKPTWIRLCDWTVLLSMLIPAACRIGRISLIYESENFFYLLSQWLHIIWVLKEATSSKSPRWEMNPFIALYFIYEAVTAFNSCFRLLFAIFTLYNGEQLLDTSSVGTKGPFDFSGLYATAALVLFHSAVSLYVQALLLKRLEKKYRDFWRILLMFLALTIFLLVPASIAALLTLPVAGENAEGHRILNTSAAYFN